MKNISKTYYKDYFLTTDENHAIILASPEQIKAKNRNLLELDGNMYLSEISDSISLDKNLSPVNNRFSMEVVYPGLITGVGLDHEAGIEGEFKLGIHLDYTTGLPVIYGSSIKGVLRNAFNIDNLFDVLSELLPAKKEQIQKLENIFRVKKMTEWDRIIFGDNETEDRNNISIYNRDIFFDAVLKNANHKNRILASDSITPHKNNPLKDPIPLTFIRIASGCKIEFRFRLVDYKEDDKLMIKAEDKKDLFRLILSAFGIGAKTNVGYGRLKAI